MSYQNQFVRKNYFSIELKHKICKEHIEDGVCLADIVRKYNLSCHSLIHDWLRKLEYIEGLDRKTRSAYIGIENFSELKGKTNKKGLRTAEQQEIDQRLGSCLTNQLL